VNGTRFPSTGVATTAALVRLDATRSVPATAGALPAQLAARTAPEAPGWRSTDHGAFRFFGNNPPFAPGKYPKISLFRKNRATPPPEVRTAPSPPPRPPRASARASAARAATLAFALAALALAASAAPTAAQAADDLILESVEGDRVVIVTDGKTLEPRQGKAGDRLSFWDVIQTSKRAAAKVRYPDGSLLVVGRDTKFTIQPKSEGTQYNQLDWGQVRAQVTPEKEAKAEAKAKKPRFVIRTKTAVMGVRGTDFVAGFDAASSQLSLHTLEGAVDVASSESQLMAWQGTQVNAGQALTWGESAEVPATSAFKPAELKQRIQAEQPELGTVPDRPAGDEPAEDASKPTTPTPSPSPSPKPPEPEPESRLSLLSFRIGALSILQASKIRYTNATVSWNPVVRVISQLSIRGHLGGTRLKNAETGQSFPVAKIGVLLAADLFAGIHLEAGLGQVTWDTDTQGKLTEKCAMANVI
jgi:ferric-dicitrate binding protein FerR (iron transport regulator)